ncbi:hypothetical protein SESBI_17994 [Sesbania bispinosa]|nr:hypothetical protein SESBI_17994 [Sesbania bispinosa]
MDFPMYLDDVSEDWLFSNQYEPPPDSIYRIAEPFFFLTLNSKIPIQYPVPKFLQDSESVGH